MHPTHYEVNEVWVEEEELLLLELELVGLGKDMARSERKASSGDSSDVQSFGKKAYATILSCALAALISSSRVRCPLRGVMVVGGESPGGRGGYEEYILPSDKSGGSLRERRRSFGRGVVTGDAKELSSLTRGEGCREEGVEPTFPVRMGTSEMGERSSRLSGSLENKTLADFMGVEVVTMCSLLFAGE